MLGLIINSFIIYYYTNIWMDPRCAKKLDAIKVGMTWEKVKKNILTTDHGATYIYPKPPSTREIKAVICQRSDDKYVKLNIGFNNKNLSKNIKNTDTVISISKPYIESGLIRD